MSATTHAPKHLDPSASIHPETLGQASRIPGVTPAAVAVLGVFLGRLSEVRLQPDATDDSCRNPAAHS